MIACETCGHPVIEHSREPVVGCLHIGPGWTTCPCTEPGTSGADQ